MDETPGGTPRETLDWSTYGVAVRALARSIADSGFRPELILGIARGGLFVAGSLGYALAVKNTFLVNVEYYTGINERLEVPVMLPPYLDPGDLQDLRVLIADDVADTGHTLRLVKDFCAERVAEVRVAVLYQKPHSVVEPEYVWKHTDRWINFPWSTEPPVVDLEGQTVVRDA
jgi:hypoxanthine phosphoribosyltransferase